MTDKTVQALREECRALAKAYGVDLEWRTRLALYAAIDALAAAVSNVRASHARDGSPDAPRVWPY